MIISKKLKRLTIVLLFVFGVLFCYRYSPYKLQFAGYYDKIWAHRVNSTEKLESALNYFEGVELDLVYDAEQDILDVNHPPAPSIGLSFENYFSKLSDNQKPFLWLDIKNLESSNADAILERLIKIFKSKAYPLEKVLIETRYPESLHIFAEHGFMTSYYLPYDLNKKSESNLENEIQEIKQVLAKHPQLGISTNYHDYDTIKTYFQSEKKYIWVLVSSYSLEFSKIREILKDETVEAVLVNYKTLKGNR